MPTEVEALDVFYPIVPDLAWLERLVPLGVKTIQLRLKDAEADRVRREIAASLEVCIRHGCQLIVNDYWREALSLGADYIHLGQEDLAEADVSFIHAKGARLGISTHSDEELTTALAAEPSYVALGPIYETKLKVMKWGPQGLTRIAEWKRRVGRLPLVAIGGITPTRADGVLAAGADSVAVITDFLTHANPEGRVREWLTWAERARGEYAGGRSKADLQ
jgi:thiamine-phosphate pyrophosphorylase